MASEALRDEEVRRFRALSLSKGKMIMRLELRFDRLSERGLRSLALRKSGVFVP